jgi:hypothetical protein
MESGRCENAPEPVKPNQCVMAFTFPVTEREFLLEVRNSSKEFLGKYRYWSRYYAEFVRHYHLVMPEISRLGTAVQVNVTMEQFGNFFVDGHFRAVILYAHWKGEGVTDFKTADGPGGTECCDEPWSAVEFFDGFQPVANIVDKVPPDFNGVLDLCVCRPEPLVAALHRDRPACVVKDTNGSAMPHRWLYFHLSLFKLLSATEIEYTNAVAATIKPFLKKRSIKTVSAS